MSLQDVGTESSQSSESDPGPTRPRPQRNKTKIYTHFFARGNDGSIEDDTGSEASCYDSEPEDTPNEVELESKSKTRNSIKASSKAKLENENHPTNDHSAKTRKLTIGKSNPKIACSVCNENISQSNMLRHFKQKHPDKKRPTTLKYKLAFTFQCDLCRRKFKTQHGLENHILQVHVVDKPFECGICFKSFLMNNMLQKHVKRVHEDNNFKCRYCPTKSFQDSTSLEKHIETFHNNSKEQCGSESSGINHLCPVCDTWYLSDADLAKHLKKPESKSVMKCKLCSEPVYTPCRLNLHLQKVHIETPSTDASRKQNELEGILKSRDAERQPPSEKITSIPASVRNQASSTSSESFSCIVCSAFFSRCCDLDFHELQENHRRWKCPICAKLLSSKYHLKNHTQASHSDARPFKCTQEGCSKNFSVIQDLNKHMTMHDTTRVHCKECYKYIPRKTFREHVAKYHDGDREFKCDICGKLWGTAKKLKQHLLSHTDERPFPCKFCDVSYKFSKLATQHMKKCQFLSEDERRQFARYSNANLRSAEQRKSKKIDISCDSSSNNKIAATSQATQSKKTLNPKSTCTNQFNCAATSFNKNETDLKLIKQELDPLYPAQNSLDFDHTPETQVCKVKIEMVPKKEIWTDSA